MRGKKHGMGRLKRDGLFYEGNFKNGLMDGTILTYYLKDGKKAN